MTETARDRDVEAIKARALPARLDPQALIEKAIVSGASIDTLERLVALAKHVRELTAKEAFNKAVAEFQRRCPPIKKNKTATIGDRFSYKYADLGEILPTIGPLMGELGLSLSWVAPPESKPGAVVLSCIISHELGHERDSGPVEIPYRADGRMNGAQTVGSATTYCKRYSLCNALGISPDDDDDAHGTDGRGPSADGSARARAESTAAPPQSAIPYAPSTDPEAYRRESETLLPTPDEDQERQALVNGIARIIKDRKITPTQRAKLKEVWLGDQNADPMTADLAALTALKAHLEQA